MNALIGGKFRTLAEATKLVLDIQDASNLHAVIRTWGELQPVIRLAVSERQGGTSFETHPLQILMLSKITSLMRVRTDALGGVMRDTGGEDWVGTADEWQRAYRWATEIVGGES